jgi:hypothetical protein
MEKVISDLLVDFILFMAIVSTIIYGSIMSFQQLKKKIKEKGDK